MSCPSGRLPPTLTRFATGKAVAEGEPSKTGVLAGGMPGLEGSLLLHPLMEQKDVA